MSSEPLVHPSPNTLGDVPLLAVRNLEVTFSGPRRRGSLILREKVRAVRGVSFAVQAGTTVGLVGESGSGKSTIGRAILRLLEPTAGSVLFRGEDVTQKRGRQLLPFRRNVQVVFQDPYSSLNPSKTVASLIGEALLTEAATSGRQRRERVVHALELVGLGPEMLERYPHEFSGGQRQRIAIARALAVEPSLIVCDEAVSALDVSTQAQIIELLLDVQRRTGVAYLFIAHDLSVVRLMSDHLVVLNRGRIMEEGPPERVYSTPAHPYTQGLVDAVPEPNPRRQRERRQEATVHSNAPNQALDDDSCPYASRCPHALDPCTEGLPEPFPILGGGTAACHLHTAGPRLAGRPLDQLEDGFRRGA